MFTKVGVFWVEKWS